MKLEIVGVGGMSSWTYKINDIWIKGGAIYNQDGIFHAIFPNNVISSETDSCGSDLTKLKSDIEETCKVCTFFGVTELSDKGRSSHKACGDANTNQDSSCNIRAK